MFDNNIKLALLGGDARQLAVARRLSGLGFETAVWGLGHGEEALGGAVRCDRWEDAVAGCHAVILPLLGGFDKLYYRNLLYTAVTRAKKTLVIVGSKNVVEAMVANDRRTLRYTCLKDMIEKEIE